MEQLLTPPNGFRVRPHIGNPRIADLKSGNGTPLGFIVDGHNIGPKVIVAGTGAGTQIVFQDLLKKSAVRKLKGRLVLLHLDQLDWIGTDQLMAGLARIVRPLRETLLLPAPLCAKAEQQDSARAQATETILSLCERHGLIGKPEFSRDWASI